MGLKLFQIVLFIVGVFAPLPFLTQVPGDHDKAWAFVAIASGFVTAAVGTWIYLRIKFGRKAPSLRDLIVDTLHRIS